MDEVEMNATSIMLILPRECMLLWRHVYTHIFHSFCSYIYIIFYSSVRTLQCTALSYIPLLSILYFFALMVTSMAPKLCDMWAKMWNECVNKQNEKNWNY
jgi:hypothetical protein